MTPHGPKGLAWWAEVGCSSKTGRVATLCTSSGTARELVLVVVVVVVVAGVLVYEWRKASSVLIEAEHESVVVAAAAAAAAGNVVVVNSQTDAMSSSTYKAFSPSLHSQAHHNHSISASNAVQAKNIKTAKTKTTTVTTPIGYQPSTWDYAAGPTQPVQKM